MAAPKGHPKWGGRQKGSPNRITRQISEKLREMDCDPIEGMVEIATNKKNPPELRGRIYSELAQYIHPKRKAIELTGKDGAALIPLEMVDAILDREGKEN